MKIGRRIVFSIVLLASVLYGRNILIVPSDVNYKDENAQYISKVVYDILDSSIIEINNDEKDEDKKFKVKELALPVANYQKKIDNFFRHLNNRGFLEKLKNKYDLDMIVWYKFHKSTFTHNKYRPIAKNTKIKICRFDTRVKCYKFILHFDNKSFNFDDRSLDKLLINSKVIIDAKSAR